MCSSSGTEKYSSGKCGRTGTGGPETVALPT